MIFHDSSCFFINVHVHETELGCHSRDSCALCAEMTDLKFRWTKSGPDKIIPENPFAQLQKESTSISQTSKHTIISYNFSISFF